MISLDRQGLRCQDVNLGLRTRSDSWSETILDNTRVVGMAADLAGLIRGRNVITNITALKMVASETLDIPGLSLDAVLSVLREAGFIEVVKNGNDMVITERIPAFRDLYPELGGQWSSRGPRQIEEEVVAIVDLLAKSPVPIDDLVPKYGFDKSDVDDILKIGRQTSVIRYVDTLNGCILYSPFTAFENPDKIHKALENHAPAVLSDALGRVSEYQGLPIEGPEQEVLADAIALGVISAPAVQLPNGDLKAFAALPHTVDPELTTIRKSVLDKALSILACVRCGQHYGGATNTRSAAMLLNSFMSRGYINAHSSHERQYKLLRDQGIVHFQRSGEWVIPVLIQTEENIEAMEIALGLLSGENLESGRSVTPNVQGLLDLDAKALKSFQTSSRKRNNQLVQSEDLSEAFESLMGYSV